MTPEQNIQNIRDAQLDAYLTDSELTDDALLEAEKLIVSYALNMAELPKEIELDSFDVVKIEEALCRYEIEALKELIKNDDNFDLSEDDFYDKYFKLSSRLSSENVIEGGEKLLS